MWAVSYVSTATATATGTGTGKPLHRHIPISIPTLTPRKSLSHLIVSLSAADSHSQRHQNDIGGLGRTILTAIKSNPTTTTVPTPKPHESDGEDGSHISGSDVLWAMRKVADKNKKKNKSTKKMKKSRERESKLLSSVGGRREDSGGSDYESDDDDARPLVVKSEWASKLDELEKRLNDLSQTQTK